MIIQISCLGHLGKWGNQIGQYLTVKSIAEELGAEFRCPKDWIGRKIFDIEAKDCISSVKFLHESDMLHPHFSFDNYKGKNLELYGFFQNPFFYKFISRLKSRERLKFKEKWLILFPKPHYHYIACHLRRGDMMEMHHSYPVLSESSYLKAIQNVFGNLYTHTEWISEETRYVNDICDSEEISFLPDFMMLYHADYLFRANSTFSFWAGFLGNGNMYSPVYDFPDYGNKVGIDIDVEFVEGLGLNKEGVFKE